jgi:hypothetical protein
MTLRRLMIGDWSWPLETTCLPWLQSASGCCCTSLLDFGQLKNVWKKANRWVLLLTVNKKLPFFPNIGIKAVEDKRKILGGVIFTVQLSASPKS